VGERFGERVRIDPLLAEARADEKNDRLIAVVIGQLLQHVVEKALRHQPEPRDRGGQPALSQDEAAKDEQRSTEQVARARARQQMVEPGQGGAEQQ
jgi:hypothetical protein